MRRFDLSLSRHKGVALLLQLWRAFWLGLKRFEESENRNSAAVLTLTTLFGAVPFLTVLSFALSWLPEMQGLADQVRVRLFEHFAPDTVVDLQNYLKNFARQTKQLTLIGFLFIIFTALIALKNIERAFNKVWRIPEGRRGVSGFLLYWAVLSLGPLFLGAGLFVTSYLFSLPFVQSATQWTLGKELLSWLPWLLSACSFSLIYIAVPNCKVSIIHAVVGGLLVAAIFELAKKGFSWFVVLFPSYRLIYGAFAILPLFIVWLYLCWCLILLGMEWIYLMGQPQQVSSYQSQADGLESLRVIQRLWQAQKQQVWLNISEALVGLSKMEGENLLERWLSLGWIAQSKQGQIALTLDPSTFYLENLLFEGGLPLISPDALSLIKANALWEKQLLAKIKAVFENQKQTFAITLNELFEADK